VPLLRPLPVDLEVLSEALEGDPGRGGGRLDLTSGDVWDAAALEDRDYTEDEDEDDDPERWLWIEALGSRPG
jgi:hypothetical protein